MSIWKRIVSWFVQLRIVLVQVELSPKKTDRYKVTIEWDNATRLTALGEGTVYHQYPSGTRLPTELEIVCSNAVVAYKWEESC
jgi:hypothetical protein